MLPLDDVGLIRGISESYFGRAGQPQRGAREVAAAWSPYCSVATWYIGARWTRAGRVLTRPSPQTTKGVHLWRRRISLDFEQPIAELENKIEELRYVQTESAVDISEEIEQLGKKSLQLTKDIYSQLTLADHQDRASRRPALHAGLRQRHLHAFRRTARRPPFRDDLAIVGGWRASTASPAW